MPFAPAKGYPPTAVPAVPPPLRQGGQRSPLVCAERGCRGSVGSLALKGAVEPLGETEGLRRFASLSLHRCAVPVLAGTGNPFVRFADISPNRGICPLGKGGSLPRQRSFKKCIFLSNTYKKPRPNCSQFRRGFFATFTPYNAVLVPSKGRDIVRFHRRSAHRESRTE